ncbi:hypothetical protein AGMMS4956_03080 [Bacteroidia bacterium]|nr:hypothetical protein AGMMS4956_03080 [Bacteroidia bacterium]
MRYYFCSLAILLLLPFWLRAADAKETFNPIQVASPTLVMAPDARASGMGDMGVATTPDANSQHWNAAKYAFIPNKVGGSLSYIPWLRNLVPDVNISYLSVFYKLDDLQAIATSLRYFSLGSMQLIDDRGAWFGDADPFEMAWDASYTRLFGEHFSMGLTLRYIRSDLTGGANNGEYNAMTPANAFGSDLSFYYQNGYLRDSEYAFGLCISNLGTKISYNNQDEGGDKHFLPMAIRLGGRYSYSFDDDNRLMVGLELSKLLVPSPAVRDVTTDEILKGKEDDVSKISVVQAMFQSFVDAPYGFKEEMSEIMSSWGAEYGYQDLFFARFGYFHDSKRKGNRRYLTFGAGVRYSFMTLDLAYYYTFTNNDPMKNTLKLSLGFYFK